MTRISDGMAVRLTTADWIKLLGLSLMHVILLLGLFWRIHLEYEHRITIVETNQINLIKMLDSLDLKHAYPE